MGQTLSGGEIYDNFHAKATGTGSLMDSQEAGLRLSRTYLDRADTVQRLIEGIRSGWTGVAADAATQGLMPFAESALQTGQDLDSAQDLIYRQIDSFHSAAARVQPMPPEPAMQNVITTIANNQPIQPMLDQIQAYNVAAANNVDVYDDYANASQFNAINTPDVSGTMTTETAPVRVIGAATPTPLSPSTRLSQSRSVANRITGPVRTSAGVPGRSDSTATTRPGGAAPDQETTSSGESAPVERLRSAPTPESIPPTLGGLSPASEDSAAATTMPATGTAAVKAGEVESRAGDRRDNGAVAVPIARGRGGPDADGTVGETMGERTEPAISGRDGAPGMPGGPVGAGRGRDEDREHQRKYGVGEDPDTLFVAPAGALAPEVLGELESERAARHERESGR